MFKNKNTLQGRIVMKSLLMFFDNTFDITVFDEKQCDFEKWHNVI